MKKSKIAIVLSFLMIWSMAIPVFADNSQEVLNRGEFVKALVKLAHIEVKEVYSSSFVDVNNPENIPYIETAFRKGIASGYNNYFYPEAKVTKEQALIMIVKSFGEFDVINKITPKMIQEYITFNDKDKISNWAKAYVAYGIMKGIVDTDKELFNPKDSITLKELEVMMAKAKAAFTREGMTASEMLIKASDKLLEYKTMKYSLEMNMTSKVIDKSQQEKPMEIIMNMLMDASVDQENNKIYLVGITKIEGEDETVETTTEMIMDDYSMLIKYPGGDKWLKQDLNPIIQELQALMGTDIQNTTGISKHQMEIFGMMASYLAEEKIDGEDYYVILITVDKETFKKAMDEILEKVVLMTVETMGAQSLPQGQEEEMKQFMEAMISEMIKGMDMEVQYKYYINKNTKELKKIAVDQIIHMMMGSIEQHTISSGIFYYYDFNKPVEIPVIPQEDIMVLDEMAQLTF